MSSDLETVAEEESRKDFNQTGEGDITNNINADNIPTKEGLDGNSDVLLDEE